MSQSNAFLSPLIMKKCTELSKGTPPLNDSQIALLLGEVKGWKIDAGFLAKTFRFKDYGQTTSFVNATAYVSNKEDHHPDILLTFNSATLKYRTHSVDGLSENDFICAAKIDALQAL